MKQLVMAGLALSAAFAAVGEAHAYVNYPWCAFGEGRGMDCVFASKEQCARDGRGRGFGGQCIANPNYNPALGSVISPAQASTRVPVKATGHHRHKQSAY
jgi:Protein of unknown function (DUF3551)